ncbi:tyrosine-type recombinase/integrase [Caballeronia zhejiangensis]|uniref:tyrosine-type recombinase/integrase n=1 Tax=Caballeronia zhejiangensis TaxID=871203 RepID=UPI000A6713B7|nr:tyrosine-type recombinase/integrase [Caballeronia zhejiangensis]
MTYNLSKVGKIYHCRFTIDGKRVQKSTSETNRHRAEEAAQRIFREAALWARKGRVIPTLRELVAQWISTHQNVASASHLKGMERFARLHLFDLADMPISCLTTEAVEAARSKLLTTHAAGAANHWTRQIRLVCNWAVRREVVPAIPFRIKMIKVQRRPRATLPVDLTAQWLAALDARASDAVRLAVRLMLGMGLRESETATARWEWIDTVRQTYTPGMTKGREAEPLPMPAWLIDYLRPYRKPSGLIVARTDGRQYARGFTRLPIGAANHAIGISHITPHRLRGTFATLLSENGAPVQSVQRTLRHKDVRTTIGYLEVDMHRVAIAQGRMADAWSLR